MRKEREGIAVVCCGAAARHSGRIDVRLLVLNEIIDREIENGIIKFRKALDKSLGIIAEIAVIYDFHFFSQS
jgi:hypothetical protein